MTREEQAAIRARCVAKDWITTPYVVKAREDIFALLDALDEADENQNTYLGFTAKEWHEKGVALKEGLEKALADCIIDRDRWKDRVEALEQAIKDPGVNGYGSHGKNSTACLTCTHRNVLSILKPCRDCDANLLWQFAEAQFAVEKKEG